jgi:ligand-binding sensor domain-containing protein
MSFAVNGMNLFAGTNGYGVFLSTNNCIRWYSVQTGLTNGNVYALAISDTNIYAGTDDGVFLSTNNGGSWAAVNTGLTNRYISDFAISGINLFVGTTLGGVFLSTNNGTSWIAINTGLTDSTVNCLAICDTNLFAGTNSGIWRLRYTEVYPIGWTVLGEK